jgi:hypothetical protein
MAASIEAKTNGIALSPEELNRASTAFEEAWNTFATMHDRDRADRSGFECRRLAMLVMNLAQDGVQHPEEIAAASIDRMRFSALN